MRDSGPSSGEVPTLLVRDSEGRDLLCFLEQLIPLDGADYALLTPVDTPVSLFRLKDGDEPEPITTIASSEPILSVADVVLQEHDLTLVRSAVTLTVSGELDEPDPDDHSARSVFRGGTHARWSGGAGGRGRFRPHSASYRG